MQAEHRRSLEEVGGVGTCRVDLDAKRVIVDYDPAAVDPTAITAAIEDAGYPVS
ncbi:MAG: heavy metal-associated domain-containing protein [Ilumatobacteraceae bacterium]